MGSTSKNVTVGGQGGDKSTTNVNRAFTGAASNTPAARQTAADDSNGTPARWGVHSADQTHNLRVEKPHD